MVGGVPALPVCRLGSDSIAISPWFYAMSRLDPALLSLLALGEPRQTAQRFPTSQDSPWAYLHPSLPLPNRLKQGPWDGGDEGLLDSE